MVEIKPMKKASRASDRDPMADVTCVFITLATWGNIRRPSLT